MTRGIGGGGGAENRTLSIPTTNLADTDEIRQWFRTPSDGGATVLETTLLNEAGQAPADLELVVYDYDSGAEKVRVNGSTGTEPDTELESDSVHYLAIENNTGTTQNANAVLALEVS